MRKKKGKKNDFFSKFKISFIHSGRMNRLKKMLNVGKYFDCNTG